jgi:LmbE family N-acetylglucosaminyl deacetylase
MKNISLIGHLITTASFFVLIVYTNMRQKSMTRTTEQTRIVYLAIMIVSIILTGLNLMRAVIEFLELSENAFTLTLDVVGQYSGVLAQTVLILMLYENKIIVKSKPNPGRVLVIGAHPDDIELAVGATLAKMHDAGYLIAGMVMTKGEKGGNGKLRPLEAKNGGLFLGLDTLQMFDFHDTHLYEDGVLMTAEIEKTVADFHPDMIFTHSTHDIHQDHKAVFEATMRAVRNVRTTILSYESPSVTKEFQPNYFVDICGYVDVKMEAVHQHWDQRTKPYMRPDLIRGKLAVRGSEAKVEYAEGFEVVRMVSAY